MTHSRVGILFLAFAGSSVLPVARGAAQAPPQAPAPPAAAASVRDTTPLLRPPSSPSPSVVAPRRTLAPQRAVTSASVAPIRPMARVSPPPDSLRPSATAAAPLAPPSNAIAQCNDGAFVVPPAADSSCATHRGVRVVLPRRVDPARDAATRAAATAAARAPVVAQRSVQPAPASDATMRCKDGTYLSGPPSANRCASLGGVAVLLPSTPAPPPRRP